MTALPKCRFVFLALLLLASITCTPTAPKRPVSTPSSEQPLPKLGLPKDLAGAPPDASVVDPPKIAEEVLHSSSLFPGPRFSSQKGDERQVGWNSYWFRPSDHPLQFPPAGDGHSEGELRAWLIETNGNVTHETVVYARARGVSFCGGPQNVMFDYAPLSAIRKVVLRPDIVAVAPFWPQLKFRPGIAEDEIYFAERTPIMAFGSANIDRVRKLLSETPGVSDIELSRNDGSHCPTIRIQAQVDSFAALKSLAERPEFYHFDILKRPNLAAEALGPDERCTSNEDCQSGLCSGRGCEPMGGTCARIRGVCSGSGSSDFCDCEGQTFRAYPGCPFQRYEHSGACKAER